MKKNLIKLLVIFLFIFSIFFSYPEFPLDPGFSQYSTLLLFILVSGLFFFVGRLYADSYSPKGVFNKSVDENIYANLNNEGDRDDYRNIHTHVYEAFSAGPMALCFLDRKSESFIPWRIIPKNINWNIRPMSRNSTVAKFMEQVKGPVVSRDLQEFYGSYENIYNSMQEFFTTNSLQSIVPIFTEKRLVAFALFRNAENGTTYISNEALFSIQAILSMALFRDISSLRSTRERIQKIMQDKKADGPFLQLDQGDSKIAANMEISGVRTFLKRSKGGTLYFGSFLYSDENIKSALLSLIMEAVSQSGVALRMSCSSMYTHFLDIAQKLKLLKENESTSVSFFVFSDDKKYSFCSHGSLVAYLEKKDCFEPVHLSSATQNNEALTQDGVQLLESDILLLCAQKNPEEKLGSLVCETISAKRSSLDAFGLLKEVQNSLASIQSENTISPILLIKV